MYTIVIQEVCLKELLHFKTERELFKAVFLGRWGVWGEGVNLLEIYFCNLDSFVAVFGEVEKHDDRAEN
jgi:hypothetical protein